jgi:hypothetical protein
MEHSLNLNYLRSNIYELIFNKENEFRIDFSNFNIIITLMLDLFSIF